MTGLISFLNAFRNERQNFPQIYTYEHFLLFLDGCLFCEELSNSSSVKLMEQFKNYICEHYDVSNTVRNQLLLLKYFAPSDEISLDIFYELYAAFTSNSVVPTYTDDIYEKFDFCAHKDCESTLLNYLLKIKENPQFVGSPPSFHHLLEILLYTKYETESVVFIENFTNYVFNYYNIRRAIRPSLTLLTIFTESDEAAFYKFFELLDLFLKK